MGISILNKIKVLGSNFYDAVLGAEPPKIYYDPKGKIKDVLEKLPQLKQKYRPTPWLSNTHVHLLYFDIIRKKTIKLNYDRIDQLTMQDGGVTAIAWYGYDLAPETPTIVIMHTITGTPESMRELVKDLHEYTGWRIALCLRRGHAGLPMPVPQISLFGSTHDLKEQLIHIHNLFPTSDLYAVGSSAGTGLLVRYLGEQGTNTPFKAAFAMCPGYNTEIGFKNVHPFYSKIMTKKLFKNFIDPYQKTWSHTASLKKVLASTTLEEFEKEYYEMAGFQDYQSYCQAINPIYVFENVKIPLIILNAEDDPVCSIKNLEPYKHVIQQMDNIAVITTKKGSHCGFYEGFNTRSWAARLMADFLKHY
ncbi:alpha/beta hydrolase [Acinetobacter guerrae]|uniref:Alpha/beta hydrolase n=1 Tax=Acinetobacter guerrae TaxID=1843371 RepID=A0A3A8EKF8_9GAMM|nr:alpha/beta fold hydrolase [Acinetobacter guerrae]RKG35382.1 alpha/beta hydrolase [Acinetobacter guerrae]